MTKTLLLLLLALPVLVGCSQPSLSSGENGFVSGDGTVTVLPAEERGEPVTAVEGETVEGEPVSLEDYRGKVVVMPVWGSWCSPCRKEAPMLTAAAEDLADDDIAFLGINSRDPNVADVKAFVRAFDVSYPSIYDEDGSTLLAFHGTLPPMTIPAFVLIDAEGRVAGRVLGEVDTSTLYGVLEEITGKELLPEAAAEALP